MLLEEIKPFQNSVFLAQYEVHVEKLLCNQLVFAILYY